MTEENTQNLLRQEAYIEEERRCLDWCYENIDECDDGEIEELNMRISKLEQKLEEDRVKFEAIANRPEPRTDKFMDYKPE